MMRAVRPDVSTVALGCVSGAAALILASGAKGKRLGMRNARVILNQPLGGVQGSSVDVRLQAAEQNRNLKIAQLVLSSASGLSMDEAAELLDRDSFLCACACCGLRMRCEAVFLTRFAQQWSGQSSWASWTRWSRAQAAVRAAGCRLRVGDRVRLIGLRGPEGVCGQLAVGCALKARAPLIDCVVTMIQGLRRDTIDGPAAAA